MILECRNLFIDTSYFVNKLFDFESKELSSLIELVDQGLLKVFLTDITEREIRKKIADKINLALSKVMVSDVRVLKGISAFEDFLNNYDEKRIIANFVEKFEKFKKDCEVTIISSDQIKLLDVFESYCSESPPFDSNATKNRKTEFPDAFALYAIVNWANTKTQKAYLLSTDSDWKSFADKSYNSWPFDENDKRFFYLSELSELLNLVIRHEESLSDLTKFADQLIDEKKTDIEFHLINTLKKSVFDPISFDADVDIKEQYIISAKMLTKDIISVSRDGATYNITFNIQAIFKYNIIDYDASPWDPEDRRYLYLESFTGYVRHIFSQSFDIEIGFEDGIARNFEILEIDTPVSIPIDYDDGEHVEPNDWVQQLPVRIFGVSEGKITGKGIDSQEFANINEAKIIFPELDIFKKSEKFSASIGDRFSGYLDFEVR